MTVPDTTIPTFVPGPTFRASVDRRAQVLIARRRRLRRTAFATLAVVMIGAWPAYLLDRWNRVDRVDLSVVGVPDNQQTNTASIPSDVRDEPADSTPIPGQTWLLFGIDRSTDVGLTGERPATVLTDAIVLVRITNEGGLRLLSVPRDLWVQYASGGTGRINAAYVYGGPTELVATLVDTFDVRIDHLIGIDMDGFAQAVDAAGGIDGQFDDDLRSTGSRFEVKGGECVELGGSDVLAYVRARTDLQAFDDATSAWITIEGDDIDRTARQRALMTYVLPQVVDAVRSPLGLTRLADVAADHLTLDDDTGLGDLRDLADRFGDVLAAAGEVAIEGRMVPGTPAMIGGAAVLEPEPEVVAAEIRWLLTGELPMAGAPDGGPIEAPRPTESTPDPAGMGDAPLADQPPNATIRPCPND